MLYSGAAISAQAGVGGGALLAKRAFQIERDPREVCRWVSEVHTAADAERDALGFLPRQAYEQAASQGTLFVALIDGRRGRHYAGHILFSATYPHAKIFQVHVTEEKRGSGLGRQLVQTLIGYLEERQYLSATAKVASELPANEFWHALGFDTVATKAGGSTRGRTINIRARQFNTPALFGYRRPVSGLPLRAPLPSLPPVFAIDLNVFFDVVKRRPRSEFGGAIMTAAFNNIVRLTVTEELTSELRRSPRSDHDPLLEFALQLPTLPAPHEGVNEVVLQELALIVFPDRARSNSLTVQDRSDLRHLAIAAHHKITGFVTAEDALVRASPRVESTVGIRIIHVRDLAQALHSATQAASPLEIGFSSLDLHVSEMNERHLLPIRQLVGSLKLPRHLDGLAVEEGAQTDTRRSLVVAHGEDVICAALWRPQALIQGVLEALLLVNEDHASAQVAVNALLNQLSRIATRQTPAQIRLFIPNSATAAQTVAIRYGFMRCPGAEAEVSLYQRLAIGRTVDPASWPIVRRNLEVVADMRVAEQFSVISDNQMRIQFHDESGTDFLIDLFDLETILSPTLFVLPNRSAVIVPIRARYARDLLGTSHQGSLLPQPKASILHERTYFSHPRNARLLLPGTAVVFYESGKDGGRSAAVALARVTDTMVLRQSQIAAVLLDSGVVTKAKIATFGSGDLIAATRVDNLLKLQRPVSLKELRDFGCVDGANLITSKIISPEQLQRIAAKGQGTCE